MNTATIKSQTLLIASRDDDVPIRFFGIEIGFGIETTKKPTTTHSVWIFRTADRHYVAAEYFNSECNCYHKQSAEWFLCPEAMINWLRDSHSGKLSTAAVKALRAAAEYDADVEAAFVEDVK